MRGRHSGLAPCPVTHDRADLGSGATVRVPLLCGQPHPQQHGRTRARRNAGPADDVTRFGGAAVARRGDGTARGMTGVKEPTTRVAYSQTESSDGATRANPDAGTCSRRDDAPAAARWMRLIDLNLHAT
jgi:hypothetical protein